MESGGRGHGETTLAMELSSSSSVGRKRTRDLMTSSNEGGGGDSAASPATSPSPSAMATTSGLASTAMMAAGYSNGTPRPSPPRELSILLTQCLQRDFIEPFSPLEGPPNLLHIGELQAYRILGQQPETGPLAILFSWAREQQRVLNGNGVAEPGSSSPSTVSLAPITRTPSEISLGASSNTSLEIIHIRDWHDPNDPAQQQHLTTFGSHCIQNTRGAELVANLEEEAKKNPGERFVNATGLNDCEETELLQIINSMIEKRGATRLRIGVIGVWTDAKVLFLLYDLHSRLKKQNGPPFEVKLATCSALTGGSSLVAHTLALQQMKTLLNVEVIDSVADFSEWLLPSFSKATNPKRRFHVPVELPMYCPKIRLFALNALSSSASSALSLANLSETDRRILCFLYRNCSQITLKRLRGGFSGSSVWRVESVDSFGNIQIPSVLKLGQRKTIAQERVNFEMIADILGNNTPQVRGYVEEGDRGGIRFNYAVMSTGDGGNVEPFTVIYHDQPQEVVEKVLKELFQGILWRMYSAAKHELLDLFAYYDFDGKGWSWSKGGSDTPSEVRKRIESLLPGQSNSDMLKFPGEISLYNIARFLEKDLPRISQIQRSRHEHHLVSLVHGDLHGGNILIDKTLNIWLIDFGYAGKGHVLKDITKLENDILYEMTPIDSEEEFLEGITIIKTLLGVRDLCKRLPETLAGVTSPSMQKAWRFTRLLRIILTGICKNERNAFHLLVPLLRYALHSLSFDHLTIWQKRLALAASCMIAQNITVRRRFNIMEYTIEWVPLPSYIPGQLCFGYLPGRKDRTGSLEKDLEKVAQSADIVFSFNTEEEVSWFGVTNLQQSIEEAGLQFMATPLVSGSGVSEIREILRKILELLRRGKRVLLIEAATLYRVGMTVACLCVSLNPKMSMEDVQEEIHAIFHDDRLMDNPNVQELVKEFSESLNRTPFSPNLLRNSSSPPLSP